MTNALIEKTKEINEKEELPQGWVECEFHSCVKKITITNKVKQKEYLEEGLLPVIDQGQNYIGGYYNNKDFKVNCELPVIIFGDHTRAFKFINFDFIAGADGVKILKPEKFFNPKLFYYFVQILKFPNRGYSRHYQYLEKTILPIPPLPEQVHIVEKIEELFSNIDAGIEKLEQAKLQIKQYKQSVLKSAFEGKLYKTSEWEDTTLGEVITPKRNRINPNKDNEEMIFIGMDCIEPNSLFIHNQYKFKETKSTAFLFDKNDVLYGRMRSYLNKVFKSEFSGAASAEFIVFPENDKLDSDFLKYLLHQQDFVRFASRNASGDRPRVKFEADLAPYKFNLPTYNEQQKIVEEIEKRFEVADILEKSVIEGLEKSKQLKQSILKKAFEGRLVPQDPNDESAMVLLEKIKTEKAAITEKATQSKKKTRGGKNAE